MIKFILSWVIVLQVENTHAIVKYGQHFACYIQNRLTTIALPGGDALMFQRAWFRTEPVSFLVQGPEYVEDSKYLYFSMLIKNSVVGATHCSLFRP